MLGVEAAPQTSPRHEARKLEESSEIMEGPMENAKLEPPKRKLFSPINIMLVVSVIALIGIGAYVVMDFTSEKDMKSSINETHSKIITHADSSQKGSSSGSSSSRSSNTNSKPNGKSAPAQKGVISSNQGLLGKGGNAEGEDPNEDEEDNGDKRGKKLRDTTGTSTVESDSEEESDLEEEDAEQGVYWVDSKRENSGATPLVGATRP